MKKISIISKIAIIISAIALLIAAYTVLYNATNGNNIGISVTILCCTVTILLSNIVIAQSSYKKRHRNQ